MCYNFYVNLHYKMIGGKTFMSKSTNNIIETQKEDKERILRETLKPIITDAVNSGFSQTEIVKIVKELWQENRIYFDVSEVNMAIGRDLLVYEKDFRTNAKAFIENYGQLFMFLDESPKFYEDMFWTMYVCLIIDHNITKELVFKRFIASKYAYKHHMDFFDVDVYHRMSSSISRKLKINEKNHILSGYLLSGIEISKSIEFEKLLTYSSSPVRSLYKKFALNCLTCIIYFM